MCSAGRGHVWAPRSPRSPKGPRAAVPGLHTPRKRPSRFRPKISSSHLRAELTLTHAPPRQLAVSPPPRLRQMCPTLAYVKEDCCISTLGSMQLKLSAGPVARTPPFQPHLLAHLHLHQLHLLHPPPAYPTHLLLSHFQHCHGTCPASSPSQTQQRHPATHASREPPPASLTLIPPFSLSPPAEIAK